MFSKGKISLIATFHKLKVFLGHRTNRVFPSFAYLSVVKHADRYKMDHPKRGRAYIFNHETFNPHLNLPPRTGTAKDRHDLSERLQELEFEVTCYNNPNTGEINIALLESKSIRFFNTAKWFRGQLNFQ